MAVSKKTIYAVSKTHWDREWYLDFQNFRVRLVRLVDNLLDILERDPGYVSFMMDGQMIPIEDYLAVKPEAFDRIKKLVLDGRLVIGPWYVLPDEVLISGESHIRNWLMGERLSRKFGKKMNIGYLPDSFGHPSQMPQILAGLGMKQMTFWRGATEDVDKNEFYWESPDGSKIFVNLMPIGYSTGAEFPDDPDLLAKRLDKYIDDSSPRASTDVLYLSNGGDHLEAVPYLSKVIKGANQKMKKGKIVHTTLEEFFTALEKEIKGKSIKTHKGEMMGTHTAIILTSTISTRMYLKQANFEVQSLLENTLEPIHSFAALQGYPYPKELILEAWRSLLQNQPHDSICGCSIDAVHRDMIYRYNQSREIGSALLDRCSIFYNGISAEGLKGDIAAAVFNSSGISRSDTLNLTVDLDPVLMGKIDFNETGNKKAKVITIEDLLGRDIPASVKAFDGEKEIPCFLNSAEVFTGKLKLNPYTFPNQYCTLRCNITLLVKDVPPMGYKTISFKPVFSASGAKTPASCETLPISEIENEFFKVCADTDGSFKVFDKKTKALYTGIGRLADSGDCGDEYTYCPPEYDSTVFADPSSLSIKTVKNGKVSQAISVSGIFHLPETTIDTDVRRSGKLVDCSFTTRLTLYYGIPRLDMETQFDNKAEYHRLRVLFPLGFKAGLSVSAGAFSVDERPVEKVIEPGWQEYFTTNPQKEFCDVSGDEHGLTIANRGLPEFEVYNEESGSVIAVTLLRCVGEISKWKMRTRKDRGGWLVFAPEGQCKGAHSFQYSVIPHKETWETSASYIEARNFAVPLSALPVTPTAKGPLPQTQSFLSLSKGLNVTCFKPCEFEEGHILRFYNTTTKKIKGAVEFKFPVKKAFMAGLNEETLSELTLTGGKVQIDVPPFWIVTLKLR
ncbi:alpha-mannosidase [Leadbettera azotonutricia]|uniref:Glycoside hydrolase, family 38 n=1 Tax=Leadbettera azotonutricia (strain ATCC BAA-888 / DSM 13862 / ZAS-9) TaxID=545695 RepID=F5YEG4_LEAAZ|nr:glycosyl hydrolase-related protein [Leadbettera azotonutricia]AEF82524.1 glycoside hydrolase, family 38 [Leadbettera azotonutricia ZAS-9]